MMACSLAAVRAIRQRRSSVVQGGQGLQQGRSRSEGQDGKATDAGRLSITTKGSTVPAFRVAERESQRRWH